MTRQNVQSVLVAVVLIGVAGVAAGQSEELVRVIAIDPGGRFTLGNLSGDITVTGVDGDHLTIRATKRVSGRAASPPTRWTASRSTSRSVATGSSSKPTTRGAGAPFWSRWPTCSAAACGNRSWRWTTW